MMARLLHSPYSQRASEARRGALIAWLIFALVPAPQLPALTPQTAAAPAVVSAGSERRNVGRFLHKLRQQTTVTVGYFGGSVAVGMGTSNPASTSYRALVTAWLRQQAPQAKLLELDASVAGTGLLYGALRTRRDLLAYKPDLVLLDFAVPESNDAPESRELATKALEGILRQLLIVPSPPEVLLLYTTDAQRSARAEWFEPLAAHYQIPSLDLQTLAWQAREAGTLSANLFAGTSAGQDALHRFYAQHITEFLAQQQTLPASPLLRTLPNPLVSDELNYGEARALAEFKHTPQWKKISSNERALPTQLLTSNKAGATLELYFDGAVVGLTYLTAPNGGSFECLIDDRPAPAPLNRIETYSESTRMQARVLASGLFAGEHKLTIRLLPDRHPRSKGNALKLGALLVGGQRPERL